MIRTTRSNLVLLFFCLAVMLGSIGCKNQQKIAEEQGLKIRTENNEKVKSILTSILNDDGKMTLEQKEVLFKQAKSIGSEDPEVMDLMAQVQNQLDRERDSKPLAAEPEVVMETNTEPTPASSSLMEQVSGLFNGVAEACSMSGAKQLINNSSGLFASPETSVLIVIGKSGDIKDYDEPTTISKYLNYLKDQKSNPNQISNLVLDDNGKIKEVELIKK